MSKYLAILYNYIYNPIKNNVPANPPPPVIVKVVNDEFAVTIVCVLPPCDVGQFTNKLFPCV